MRANQKQNDPKRHYPTFWERAIPFALAAMAVAIVILLILTIIVLFGLFPMNS